jgi:hypothetical protein
MRAHSDPPAVYHLFTLRFAFVGKRVKKAGHRKGGDSVINQLSKHLRSLSSAMLSPASLIDRLLDQIDRLGAALMPVQADQLSCQRIRSERRLD